MYDILSKPLLTEPGIKYFLYESLKQCHKTRETIYNLAYNFGLLFIFILILILILYFKFKGKLTPSEKREKDKQKKEYILSKITKFQDEKKRLRQELITGLPAW